MLPVCVIIMICFLCASHRKLKFIISNAYMCEYPRGRACAGFKCQLLMRVPHTFGLSLIISSTGLGLK